MPTQNQIEANRRNAQHSTGPRTIQGKAASSMNALQSGIHAASSVIPGEDSAALTALTERFYQDCQPQTVIESTLVDNIIRASWLLRRFDRIDAEILIHMMEDTSYPCPNAPAGKAFHQSSSTQARLQRRINDTHRLQREAIQELRALQATRPQPPALQPALQHALQPAPQPAPKPTETESPAFVIGFVPQIHVPVPASGPAAPPFSPHVPLAGSTVQPCYLSFEAGRCARGAMPSCQGPSGIHASAPGRSA